ncbi:MAG: hypothetical protein HY909_02435 [Deltaproteobacteria bacterium]|nr:hypothetical protein [Deltaproteobacteria bacterium]
MNLLLTPFLTNTPQQRQFEWLLGHFALPYKRMRWTWWNHGVIELVIKLRMFRFRFMLSDAILLLNHQVFNDPLAAAEFLTRTCEPSLVPALYRDEIENWARRGKEFTTAFRALRQEQESLALETKLRFHYLETPPPTEMSLLRRVAPRLLSWWRRRFRLPPTEVKNHEQLLHNFCLDVRETLSRQGDYLLGSFSFADVAVATSLHNLLNTAPEASRFQSEMGELLNSQFSDLLSWCIAICQHDVRSVAK